MSQENKPKAGFTIQIKIARIRKDGIEDRTRLRTVEDVHLVRDDRLPSSVLLSVVSQMLFEILEGEGGLLRIQGDTLGEDWIKEQKAKKEMEQK